ncbi:simple sugar transport system permease protein [Pseudobutyrivibrio sp. UC1225]|uniref:ABC transporter permease n=1 Tax=Pseudobutyrivibrio sp. UC1225 TaxID=1798185 RepID=UPI0008EC2BCC|nr:ABC transporter permease [Pseudobutyrivibrio sp. UC1225]SFO25210.1 simple sugar transport system permease protein [Pseudobutyrivibrio sp. UC1225]
MEKTSFIKRPAVQTLLASILCAILGIVLGYIILCFMNAEHAGEGMAAILTNFFKYRIASTNTLMKYMGSFLVKSVPVILCAEAILFAYKAGLFNIGVAGQYTVGIIAALYTSLALGWSWPLCLLATIAAGALWGFIAGCFKAFFNVNEVIAGIMLNWIGLYICNIIIGGEKCMNQSKSETYEISDLNPSGLLPGFLQDVFGGNQYMTIAIPITVIVAIIILVVLNKTTFGYELKATGHNKEAAKYSGMNAKRNIILTLVISGGIAGMAAGLYYLTGVEHFKIASSVPGMGFNGIAVAFLGGLHPIGAIIAGLFVEYITLGGQYLNTNYYNPQVADLMISIIIYLCGFVLFFRTILNRPGKVKVNANAEPDNTANKAEEKEV